MFTVFIWFSDILPCFITFCKTGKRRTMAETSSLLEDLKEKLKAVEVDTKAFHRMGWLRPGSTAFHHSMNDSNG